MSVTYCVENGNLMVAGDVSGKLIWTGKPDGASVRKVVPIPNTEDCVALLDFKANFHLGDFQNLIRCDSKGVVRWRAELPTHGVNDCYTEIWWTDRRLIAYSYSGYNVTIAVGTGQILSKIFTK